MEKDLKFYLDLNYPIALRPLEDSEGGGWLAEIPDLKGCMSDGGTPEEALTNVKEAMAAWFQSAMRRGQTIPEPPAAAEEYSGKFTLRIPKTLHKLLADRARIEGVSLNRYVETLLAYSFGQISAHSDSGKSPYFVNDGSTPYGEKKLESRQDAELSSAKSR